MRSTPEWQGRTDDTPIPDRVRLRVYDRHHQRCHICTREILPGEYWECDHVKALCNGGENAERNLAPACRNCCKGKTALDVAEKSDTYEMRRKHVLPSKPKRPQSKFKRKMDGSVVLR
jgi:5-methylcytosine-specific restriction enzyme A